MELLHAFDLYRFYHSGEEETLALRGVNLRVEEGEMLAVMGPSGSGKSTLLNCLSGIDEPDGGYVTLLGQRLTRRPEAVRAAMRAKNIGIVLQSRSLLEQLTVEGNLMLRLNLIHKKDKQRAVELLSLVGLEGRMQSYPYQLSGGEIARAAIAMALAPNPRLLLADEPTGEVDALTEQHILQLFDAHRKGGGAAIIATHSESLAAKADRVLRLYDGRILENA